VSEINDLEETVDFETIKEHFDKYKLNDGSILKTKFVLVKVKREQPSPTGAQQLTYSSQNVLGIIAKKTLLRTPSEFSPNPPNIVEDDIRFEHIGNEQWNEYKLSDNRTLYIKLAVVKVSRTDRYDSLGCPIYLVNAQPLLKLN
jgi:hypothetical protein